ncbi:acylphosphatase [Salinarimonas ramus]|uniref:acylphosphatase n=1 Tax=Salinarimonas ramus TaxID=690164 RepID=A0A917V1V0_9HYPH|nr:acylphosphatase [Salinarimonas ramus]GGK18499.1 acylphosphatase [Salinarimonas ramus]
MTDAAVRIVVAGRVQGVGFRAFAAARGRELGLRGHARNRADGSVESVVAGSREAIEAYLVALRSGPPSASVANLSVEDVAPESVTERDFVTG